VGAPGLLLIDATPIHFNGSNTTLSFGVAGGSTFTFYAEIRATGEGGGHGNRMTIGRRTGASGNIFLVGTFDGGLEAGTNGPTQAYVPASGAFVVDSTWHTVRASFDGSTLRLYKDGALVGASTGSPLGSGGALVLGNNNVGSDYFGGDMRCVSYGP